MHITDTIRKKNKGVSTIMGTIIFIGILFTSVIPMMLVMKQADIIYEQKKYEFEVLYKESVNEDVNVLTYPGVEDTELKVQIENICDVPIFVLRVWFNDEYHEVNKMITTSSSENIGPYNVTVQNGTSVVTKIVTDRGNTFYGSSGDLTWFIDGGWSTTSLGICVIIQNTQGGEFQIILHNNTVPDWQKTIYESKAKEWEDVIATTPVDEASPNYEMIVKKKQGSKWKDLPGSPVPAAINWPDGPPFIMIWLQGK